MYSGIQGVNFKEQGYYPKAHNKLNYSLRTEDIEGCKADLTKKGAFAG